MQLKTDLRFFPGVVREEQVPTLKTPRGSVLPNLLYGWARRLECLVEQSFFFFLPTDLFLILFLLNSFFFSLHPGVFLWSLIRPAPLDDRGAAFFLLFAALVMTAPFEFRGRHFLPLGFCFFFLDLPPLDVCFC